MSIRLYRDVRAALCILSTITKRRPILCCSTSLIILRLLSCVLSIMCVTAVVLPLKLSGQKRAVHLKKGCQLNVIHMGNLQTHTKLINNCITAVCVCIFRVDICGLRPSLYCVRSYMYITHAPFENKRRKNCAAKEEEEEEFFFFAACWSVCVSFVLWRQLGVSHFHRLLCNIILFRERRPPRILLPFLRVTAHTVDRVSLNSYHHLLGANYTSSRSR